MREEAPRSAGPQALAMAGTMAAQDHGGGPDTDEHDSLFNSDSFDAVDLVNRLFPTGACVRLLRCEPRVTGTCCWGALACTRAPPGKARLAFVV